MPRQPKKHVANEIDLLVSKGPLNTDRVGFEKTRYNNPSKKERLVRTQNSIPLFNERVYQAFDFSYAFPTSMGKKDEKILPGAKVEKLCLKVLTGRDGIAENFNDRSTLCNAYQLHGKDISRDMSYKKLLDLFRSRFVIILQHLDIIYQEDVSQDGKIIFYRCKMSESSCRRAADYRHYPVHMDQRVTQFQLFREDPDFTAPYVPYQKNWEKTHSQTGAMGHLGHVWQRFDRISRPYDKAGVERDDLELSIFRDVDRIRLMQRSIAAYFNVTTLLENKFLAAAYPLNQPVIADALQNEWGSFKLVWNWVQPLDQIRDYYGEKLAVYYAWSTAYCQALTIPAVAGVMLYILEACMDRELNFDVPIVNWARLFYCVLLGSWATFFYQKWTRYEKELGLRWGQEIVTGAAMSPAMSPWFSHHMVESDAIHPTKFTPSVAPKTKLTRRIISNTVAVLVTILAVSVVNEEAVHAALRLVGVLGHDEKSWKSALDGVFNNVDHPWYKTLKDNWYLAFMPVVITVKIMAFLWDRIIIQGLAKFENNKYYHEYCNAVIVKSFLFKLSNQIVPILYLAFLKESFGEKCEDMEDGRCTKSTRHVLQTFFVVGFFSNVIEILVPLAKGMFKAWRAKRGDKRVPYFEAEFYRPEYTQRKHVMDFQEVMLSFAYVCLFSVIFPLLPLFSLILALVEIRSDSFAVTRYYRRVDPEDYEGSSWDVIQKTITFTGVVTNVLLCGIVTIGYNHGPVFKLAFSLLSLLAVLSVKEFIALRIPVESKKYRTQKARCHVVAYEATWGQKEQVRKLPPYPTK